MAKEERKGIPVDKIWSLASHRPEDDARYNEILDPEITNRSLTFSDPVQMDISHGADPSPKWRPGD
jgi:hypothetical protein